MNINESNCLILIKELYEKMSPTEKKIADVILSNPQEIVDATVVYISAQAGVSEGSVINFANSLGFKGFTQLKMNIARFVPKQSNYELGDTSNESEVLKHMMEDAIDSFLNTYLSIKDNIKSAVEAVEKANRVQCFGVGFSRVAAEEFSRRLMLVGIDSLMEIDNLIAGILASHLNKGDVFFAISNSGRTKEVLEIARRAKEQGAYVIGVTSFGNSPLTKISDLTLKTVSSEVKQYREPTTTRLAQFMICDGIVQAIQVKRGVEAMEYSDKVVEIYEEHRETMIEPE